MGKEQRALCNGGLVVEVEAAVLLAEQEGRAEGGGSASSAWHIDQMVQPPRLGCLGMCTGQCAVVAVSSKCWRSMLALDMSAPAYTIDEANIACVGAGGLLVEARRRTPESAGRRRRSLENVGGACR